MSDCVRKRGVGADAGASDDASHLLDFSMGYRHQMLCTRVNFQKLGGQMLS